MSRLQSTLVKRGAPRIATPPRGAGVPRLVGAAAIASGKAAELTFNDGGKFHFHALWLKDACRDEAHREVQSERKLATSPLVTRTPLDLGIERVVLEEDGKTVSIEWDAEDVAKSSFDAGYLRALAPIAGKQVGGPAEKAANDASWFEFLNGKPDVECPPPSSLNLWTAEAPQITRVPYAALASGEAPRDEVLRAIIDPGVVIVEGMPDDPALDGSTLATFAAEYLGGLQKHPRRDNAHWTISTNETVGNSNMVQTTRGATNAYDTTKQLCNHTDQSLYGTPGLLLAFHCAHGEGNNSLTDGFAVAYALRERHPEHFEMLSKFGMDAGRYLGYYDSGPLLFNTAHKVLLTDKCGNLSRVQYHESYRTAVLTVPYDDFPKYFAALNAFYDLVHSPEFQTHIKLQQGECLIMNNWRTMHGRAGLAGKTRTIIGGTVTREAFYSAVRHSAMDAAQIGVETAHGTAIALPTPMLTHIGDAVEA